MEERNAEAQTEMKRKQGYTPIRSEKIGQQIREKRRCKMNVNEFILNSEEIDHLHKKIGETQPKKTLQNMY